MNIDIHMVARRVLPALPAFLAAALLTGCGSSPPPQWVSLPSLAKPAIDAPVAAAEQPPVLQVRRIELPEAWLTRRLRYRADAVTLVEWPGAVWAERIEVAATREFSNALRASLPGWTVCEDNCPTAPRRWVLQLEVDALEHWRSEARLRSTYRVRLQGSGLPPAPESRHQREVPAPGDVAGAQAEALGAWLQAVAVQQAAAVIAAATAAAAPTAATAPTAPPARGPGRAP